MVKAAAANTTTNAEVISIASDGDDDDILELNEPEVPRIEDSTWPDANPHLEASNVISVVCGNSRYHWALHQGYEDDYYPTLFWKTTPMEPGEEGEGQTLAKYLPAKAFEIIGGTEFQEEQTLENLVEHITKQRVPYFQIYMVVTNKEGLKEIPQLFSRIPCRIIRLQAKDFISGDRMYNKVGVDRCANLTAAMHYYGKPAMVIDGGTAMTWTSTDAQGDFVGGGISPGVGIRFRSLSDNTALNFMDHNVVMKRVTECRENQSPLDTMPNNTNDAIYVGIFREIAVSLRSLVKEFSKQTKDYFLQNPAPVEEEAKTDKESVETFNKDCNVVITGGDMDILQDLISETNIIRKEIDNDPSFVPKIQKHKNLGNHAVGIVLRNFQVPKNAMSALETFRHDMLGLRVVGPGSRRGTICNVRRNNAAATDRFRIKYDDGPVELAGYEELHSYLLEFSAYGEDSSFSDLDSAARQEHRKRSQAMANQLVELIPALKEKLAKNKRALEEQEKEQASKKARGDTGGHSQDQLQAIAMGLPKPAGAAKKTATPKKKASSFPTINKTNIAANPKSFLQRRVAKYFGDDLFFGTVDDYKDSDDEDNYWHITYDDGDSEDYDIGDMVNHLKEYDLQKNQDEHNNS
uniref:Type III pantothenate kinase n=1 Tax=Entomoneis paludosa TaxID=265537 RepID=A0A7S2VDF8_9STRA|mmetsp:Transcript_17788/g.36813  ORF Transcript_17788/g.36813 Transcript_17788/m.36813 type:complete len:634 (+) Transcript_17788:188-2089(+)|eukprot:CAMPEP_0172448866 /NCGR_PEP_ID=MMETSP1065-20121228/7774_1 /TAXON_ID=265537 /ORGANISM="Amphiprora paludosa, Strain CCMP125" /LENGTH=633 /DNA_ID=CAMNT_0013200455 /DNA_START=163 /DNA_END=2064 /DNA_ORIENTATION=-